MKIAIDYTNLDEDVKTINVVEAVYESLHKIKITFDDNAIKIVDFGPFLSKSNHPSISKYMDVNLFQNFKIVDGNLNWNDYDLIFPIWDLYNGEI
jgi:hypothetical protein